MRMSALSPERTRYADVTFTNAGLLGYGPTHIAGLASCGAGSGSQDPGRSEVELGRPCPQTGGENLDRITRPCEVSPRRKSTASILTDLLIALVVSSIVAHVSGGAGAEATAVRPCALRHSRMWVRADRLSSFWRGLDSTRRSEPGSSAALTGPSGARTADRGSRNGRSDTSDVWRGRLFRLLLGRVGWVELARPNNSRHAVDVGLGPRCAWPRQCRTMAL